MKKFLALLLALVLTLSLVACGSEPAAPAVDEDPAPVTEDDGTAASNHDQLLALTQALYGMQDYLSQYIAAGEAVKAGELTEEEALETLSAVNDQAAAVYDAVQAAEWPADDYAEGIDALNQGAEAIAQYTAALYEANVNQDKAAVDAATPLFETYQAQLDALATALGA